MDKFFVYIKTILVFYDFIKLEKATIVFCKKVFLKISQNSQENICARVLLLIKLQASLQVTASGYNLCHLIGYQKFLIISYFASVDETTRKSIKYSHKPFSEYLGNEKEESK